MSLYNNVSDSLAGKGLTGSISSGLSSALNKASGSAVAALGGGKLAQAVVGAGKNAAMGAGLNAVNKYLPLQAQQIANVGAGAIGDLMRGDWNSAGLRLLDSGLLNELLPHASGIVSQQRYWGKSTPLFGGITPSEARRIYEQAQGEARAKKNLWLLEVSSRLAGGSMNMPDRFNLFATELEYSPFITTGEKRRIGGAVVDTVQGAEPVELRLTTTDDKAGNIKRWFAAHHGAAAHRDGTVGVPDEYAITIRVVHGYITAESNRGGYEDVGLFRTANMDVSLSRREDALEELQMAFSQLDTYLEAK